MNATEDEGQYQASAILSKRIRLYNENAKRLMPYLQSATKLRVVNTEQNFDYALQQLCSYVEPTILLVRPGGSPDAFEKRIQIVDALKNEKGFIELSVFALIKEETERHTEVGRQINEQISAGKDAHRDLDHLIVKMLKRIIFSGLESRNKFILTDFPDTIKQAQQFEADCAKITAVIFAAGGDANSSLMEVIDNGLSIDSIDSLMQKDNRLKAMRSWDEATFTEHLGGRTGYGVIMGGTLSGKSLVGSIVAQATKGKVLDLNAMAEAIRPRLETEDGPFEGRVPDAEVEKDVLALIEADKQAGEKFFYLFDGRYHETVEQMADFLSSNLGSPTHLINCKADEKEIQNRYKEKNEITDDLGEEDATALKEKTAAAVADLAALKAHWASILSRVVSIEFDTACSKENLQSQVRAQFQSKVILVNHEKRLDVDTVCSNLAIKYNMLYMSVYQLIREEINAETELGRALQQSYREKQLNFGAAVMLDAFQEEKFSAVHYDMPLVMQLLQQKIAESRTSQKFILLEGFCNSGKLDSKEDSLQLRFMDEFFAIEKNVGEVVGVIGLQNEKMPTTYQAESYEEVVEEVKEDAKPADADPDADPPAGEEDPEGGPAKPAWKPTDYRWSVTNGKAKNLPQLFRDYMGNRANFEEKNWKAYGATSHGDACVKALDEFCQRITDESSSMTMYQQVIFSDQD